MLKVARVSGLSMSPGLMPGDFVWALRWPARGYRPGQCVLVRHAELGLIVKRIQACEADGVWLRGDSGMSDSPQAMGLQSYDRLLGRVIWTVKKSSAAS